MNEHKKPRGHKTEAAEVNMIPRTRLCNAMKSGEKLKGYYWKFKE